MSNEEKKAYLLLKSVVFHYHGLDDGESQNLDETAQKLNADTELKWVTGFISKNYFTAFDRARVYLKKIIGEMPKNKKVEYINMVWESNKLKGYVTEMEAAAIVKFAKDWDIQRELVDLIMERASPSS